MKDFSMLLVADDESNWLEPYDHILQREALFGYRLASTPEEALSILREGTVTHILVDGTGWEDVIRFGIDSGRFVVIQSADPGRFRHFPVPVLDKMDGFASGVMKKFLALTGLLEINP